MLNALMNTAGRLVHEIHWIMHRSQPSAPVEQVGSSGSWSYQPLRQLLLTDGVARTLFEEYAQHRKSVRGDEETGWVVLGLREVDEAIALATLPAGAARTAGVAHVGFNAMAQALGSRIVRQIDRRLVQLGVVHTHPGSLRHPSDGDYRGDSLWVRHLRGREGVFGIGTADGKPGQGLVLGHQPKPHVQNMGELCLSWYSLREGDGGYRTLPVRLTLGPDLARPMHAVWDVIEAHAERLDRLARQQANIQFEVLADEDGTRLAVTIALAEPDTGIRVLLEGEKVRYFLVRGQEVLAAHPNENRVDLGVYLLLAELASQA